MKKVVFAALLAVCSLSISLQASWWNAIFNSVDMPTVAQDDETVTVSMHVDGHIDPDNIVIDIKGQTLCVYGSSENKTEENEEGFYKKAVSTSSFNRCTSLPCLVEEENVIAELSGSTLTVRMKKKQKDTLKEKKIKVIRV